MGAYNQGGGGGRAIDVTENDQFAFDQPFEIGSKFTAETANQINDMFRILFKSQRRAENKIEEVEALIVPAEGTLLSVTRDVTKAELETLSVTFIDLVAAPGAGFAIIPVRFAVRTDRVAPYTSAPTYGLQHDGNTFDTVTRVAGGLSSPGSGTAWVASGTNSGFANNTSTGNSPENKALQLKFSTALTGSGDATAKVQVWYTIWDLTS